MIFFFFLLVEWVVLPSDNWCIISNRVLCEQTSENKQTFTFKGKVYYELYFSKNKKKNRSPNNINQIFGGTSFFLSSSLPLSFQKTALNFINNTKLNHSNLKNYQKNKKNLLFNTPGIA